MTAATALDRIRTALVRHLPADGERWLADAEKKITADPAAIRSLFPAAGRRCGRGRIEEPSGWTVDDAVRALLLAALADPAGELDGLYRYGDAAEKRGVLRALALVDAPPGVGLPIVHDALRTNDTRLVAAALGPYGAEHLDAPAYRQGVLKCVFMGIPLAEISGLPGRADDELARMLDDYAAERVAAGRPVPNDVYLVINRDQPGSSG